MVLTTARRQQQDEENVYWSLIDSCSLFLDLTKLTALPVKVSDSRRHALTKLDLNGTIDVNELSRGDLQKKDLYASACAVAKTSPLKKSKKNEMAYNDDCGNCIV